AVCGLPHIHEIDELLPMIPEVAGADLNAPSRAVMWMAGDAERTLTANFSEDRVCRLIGADELSKVQRDDVRVLLASNMVLRDLRPWNHQQAIQPFPAPALRLDLGQICCKTVFRDRESAVAERGEASGSGQEIAVHQNMVGDRDHVEPFGSSVQIHDLANGQAAVTPSGVDMEITQQKGFVTWHANLSHRHARHRPAGASEARTRNCGRTTQRPASPPPRDPAEPTSRPNTRDVHRCDRRASVGDPDWYLRRGTRWCGQSRRSEPARRFEPRSCRRRESPQSATHGERPH